MPTWRDFYACLVIIWNQWNYALRQAAESVWLSVPDCLREWICIIPSQYSSHRSYLTRFQRQTSRSTFNPWYALAVLNPMLDRHAILGRYKPSCKRRRCTPDLRPHLHEPLHCCPTRYVTDSRGLVWDRGYHVRFYDITKQYLVSGKLVRSRRIRVRKLVNSEQLT